MKKISFSMLLLALVVGCDAPVRTRRPLKVQSLQDPVTSPAGNAASFNPGNLGKEGSADRTSTGANTDGSDANFTNCDLSNKYHTVDIGHFGLCQGIDETKFKVKFAMPTSIRNCLIPLYKDASGSSTYLGQPQCTLVNQAEAVINGALYKNRPSFEGYPINGVIVMKEPLLSEFFNCMHGYINWLPQACPNGVYGSPYCSFWMPRCPYGAKSNPNCDGAARTYMNETCNSFKSRYANSYADIRTK